MDRKRPRYFTHDKSQAPTLQSRAESRSTFCNSGVAATAMNSVHFQILSHKLSIHGLPLLFVDIVGSSSLRQHHISRVYMRLQLNLLYSIVNFTLMLIVF